MLCRRRRCPSVGGRSKTHNAPILYEAARPFGDVPRKQVIPLAPTTHTVILVQLYPDRLSGANSMGISGSFAIRS